MAARATRSGGRVAQAHTWGAAALAIGCALAPRIAAADGAVRFEPLATIGAESLGSARLNAPAGLSIDHRQRLFIADAGNDRIVVVNAAGRFESEFGRFGSDDGQFLTPTDVTAREGFFYYVADTENERVQKFDRFRAFVDIPFERGGQDGAYGSPRGIEIDDEGRLYVADTEQHTVWVIDSFTGEFRFQIGGFGTQEGRFDEPIDIAIGPERSIYVADAGNARVQAFDRLGSFLFAFSGADSANSFRRPSAVVYDPRGFVFVADPVAGRVFVTSPRGVLLGALANDALKSPTGLALGSDATLFVSDADAHRVRSYRVFLDEAAAD
ncbi:MAG: NHL repeat-containing protein [bacterium]